jgi:hypothetical protein
MTPDWIRSRLNPIDPQDQTYWTMGCATMLREIAAQLADLNARLADGNNPVAVALCSSNDDLRVRLTGETEKR